MIVHCRRPFSLTLARGLRITLFTLIVFSKYSEISLSVAKELRAPSDRRQIATTSYNWALQRSLLFHPNIGI